MPGREKALWGQSALPIEPLIRPGSLAAEARHELLQLRIARLEREGLVGVFQGEVAFARVAADRGQSDEIFEMAGGERGSKKPVHPHPQPDVPLD